MSPSHWLGLVHCVPFTALTLMIGWHKAHLAHKNPDSTNPQGFCLGTGGGVDVEPDDPEVFSGMLYRMRRHDGDVWRHV